MSPDAYIEMANTEEKHWWFSGRRIIINMFLNGLALPLNAKILEIGSGTGGNLKMLSMFGEVSALEMDDCAREISFKKTDYLFDIRSGACPDNIPFEKNNYDLVCLFDVLEHISDDVGSLHALKNMLVPGGRLLLTVPAYPWLWSSHDVFLHHKRRYTAKEIKNKLISAGFSIKRITFFNTLLFPLVVLFRFKDRLNQSNGHRANSIPVQPINRLLKIIFSVERYFLNNFNLPFGVSILVVAELKGSLHSQ